MAVVIHCGSGPNRGHYISIVKSHGFWLLFDDDMVDVSIFVSSLLAFLFENGVRKYLLKCGSFYGSLFNAFRTIVTIDLIFKLKTSKYRNNPKAEKCSG